MTHALVVDVDGVISPINGHTAWGDDVIAGDVFGPVYTSPAMCAQLDELARLPDLTCWWLTSWSQQMRDATSPFPGRDWPAIEDGTADEPPSRWWKLQALRHWLAAHPQVTSLARCEDHLSPEGAAVVRRWLALRGVDSLLIPPDTQVGLTPRHLIELQAWAGLSPGSRTPRRRL